MNKPSKHRLEVYGKEGINLASLLCNINHNKGMLIKLAAPQSVKTLVTGPRVSSLLYQQAHGTIW